MKRHISGTFADVDLSPVNPTPVFCLVALILAITIVKLFFNN